MSKAQLDFFNKVFAALLETEENGFLNDHREKGLGGLSGHKTVGALQRLIKLFADDPAACYLEVGVFQGLTLVSTALEASTMPCFGVDNFATLDPEGKNLKIVEQRISQFETKNTTLINSDFEDALTRLEDYLEGRKVALYFIDGPHDYRSQLVCLLAAMRHLHDQAIILIDDANYPDVRQSTYDFLTGHPEFKMVFEAYSPAHPANMTEQERSEWESGWLNGIQVLVRDPDGQLPVMMPPVDEDRTLYFNEWLVHRLQLAELAPEAVALAQAVCLQDADDESAARLRLQARFKKMTQDFKGRFADRNTYSSGLTTGRMIKSDIPG